MKWSRGGEVVKWVVWDEVLGFGSCVGRGGLDKGRGWGRQRYDFMIFVIAVVD